MLTRRISGTSITVGRTGRGRGACGLVFVGGAGLCANDVAVGANML